MYYNHDMTSLAPRAALFGTAAGSAGDTPPVGTRGPEYKTTCNDNNNNDDDDDNHNNY